MTYVNENAEHTAEELDPVIGTGPNAVRASQIDLNSLNASLADIPLVSVENYPIQVPETDDTARLQRAINAEAGNRRLFIPKNKALTISAQINIPSYTTIVLDGTIQLAANTQGAPNGVLNMIAISPLSSNVVIIGFGTIDGNLANQSTQTDYNYGTNGIKSLGAHDITILGITIKNIPNTPLLMSVDQSGNGSYNVLVDGVEIYNCGKSPRFEYYYTHDCKIVNSIIHDILTDSCFTFYNGVYRCQMIGCTVYNSQLADGVLVYNDSYGTQGACKDIIIMGNIVYGNKQNGISNGTSQSPNAWSSATTYNQRQTVTYGTSVYTCLTANNLNKQPDISPTDWSLTSTDINAFRDGIKNKDVIIQGNDVFGNNTGNGSGNAGIKNYYGYGTIIDGNTTHDNGNGSNGVAGISSTSPKSVVTNNRVYNEGKGSTTGVGIQVNNDTIVEGNMIYDNQAVPSMQYGIGIAASTIQNALINGNHLGTSWVAGGGAIQKDVTVTDRINAKQVTNNIGINPVGLLGTQPTMPATNTTTTNNYGYPVRVFVVGGTITQISINGTALGMTTGGQFVLQPGESINIQYSVAPTWKWFGM